MQVMVQSMGCTHQCLSQRKEKVTKITGPAKDFSRKWEKICLWPGGGMNMDKPQHPGSVSWAGLGLLSHLLHLTESSCPY